MGIIGGGAALVLAGLLRAYFFFRPGVPAAGSGEKSVAVLPFDNVGGDKQNDYLSDGLTTEVIFQLSKIADLRVISRDSVLGYKATPGAPKPTDNVTAYDLFLQGRAYYLLRHKDDNEKAIELFRQALELDPKFLARICGSCQRLHRSECAVRRGRVLGRFSNRPL
jgi:tetratricopeptide (TPR) repeat protein